MGGYAIGEVRVDRVVESERPLLTPDELFGDADGRFVETHRRYLEPAFFDFAAGRFILCIQSYLVRTPRHTILVDGCIGEHKERVRPFFHRATWPWMGNLRALGVAPEAVDVVLCTHLHADHVGWNTRLVDGRWVPTFPNAAYLFARVEFAHWEAQRGPDPASPYVGQGQFADSVLPVVEAGQARLVEMDHRIDDWVGLVPAPGHTPGHVVVDVRSRAERALIAGDLAHSPLQLRAPDLASRFCADPARSRATRRRFLEAHAGTPTLILPAHFPSPSAGLLVRAGEAFGFRYREAG